MSIKERLFTMFLTMCFITTALVMLYALIHQIYYMNTGVRTLYPIKYHYKYALIACLCTLPSLVFINSENDTKKGYHLRILCHFLLTISAALFGTFHFFWGGIPTWSLLLQSTFFQAFLPGFTTIYGLAFFVNHRRQKKLGDELNLRIKMMQALEEAKKQ